MELAEFDLCGSQTPFIGAASLKSVNLCLVSDASQVWVF